MRLSLRPQMGRTVVQIDADDVTATSRLLTTLNAPTYASLPTPKPTWSLASFALRSLAVNLDKLELGMGKAPADDQIPRANVLADLLPADKEVKEDPRIWAALARAYGVGQSRRMPLSDPHLFALSQPVVLDFSAPGMQTPFDDAAAVNLLAADLRALVLLDLSGHTYLTDRGLEALARATGMRGLRVLALRGCTAVGVKGVTACALAWERLEVLDLRDTGFPKGTSILDFAPPQAHKAESHFHPRSPEQIARALLGTDAPFIIVDEEDFERPDRPRPVDLAREDGPSASAPSVPAPPPAKRQRLSTPNTGPSGSMRKLDANEARSNERELLAEHARLADDAALMFVRIPPPPPGPPPPASFTPAQQLVEEEVRLRWKPDMVTHLAGMFLTAIESYEAGVSESTPEAIPAAPIPTASEAKRRVPIGKPACAKKRGLARWHGAPPNEQDDDDDDEVMEVLPPPRPPRKSGASGSMPRSTGSNPANPAAKRAAKLAKPKVPMPMAKPELLNSGSSGTEARQTTLPFTRKPLGSRPHSQSGSAE